MGIYQSLLIEKHNMEWLLPRFIDLVRIYFLLIISRNHSNTVKHYIKGYLFWYQNFGRFTQVVAYYLIVYFNDMQINRWQNFKDNHTFFKLGWLLLKCVEYLFLESFFVSLDKCFVPLQILNVQISWNFDAGLQKNIFCHLFDLKWNSFQ